MRLVRLLSLTFALLSATAHAAQLDVAKLDRAFDVLEANQRVRGEVTITKDGAVAYSRALGLRDGSAKVDSRTAMRIGSITKVFTATLIYQLIDEKKLTLQTPLSRFFPTIPNAQEITIAHLLAHTSGIANIPRGPEFGDPKSWVYQPQTTKQMVERFAATKPAFAPGEKVAYSNAGYMLLGYIIESVTGTSYDRQLQNRIARPLGLKRTHFGAAVNTAKNEAHSFTFDDNHWTQQQPEADVSAAGGGGAIVSTTEELAKFITALFGGKLISSNSLHEMLTPFSPKLDGVERKGVVVSTLHRGLEKTIYSHLGGIDAFSSNLVYFPDDRVAIAITMNGQNYPMGKLFWLLADSYYGRPVTPPSFEPIVLPADTLAKYTGVYSFAPASMDIAITRDHDQLRAQATGQDSFAIQAIGETLFSDPSSGILIEFRKDSFTLYQGRSETIFTRPSS
jgi:D-alanyl-D-alanine carboxypeptidase